MENFANIIFGLTGLLILLSAIVRGLNSRLTGLLSILIIISTILTIIKFGWIGVFVIPGTTIMLMLFGLTMHGNELLSRKHVRKIHENVAKMRVDQDTL